MPRVLIITYYWPPSGGLGMQRWLKFAYVPARAHLRTCRRHAGKIRQCSALGQLKLWTVLVELDCLVRLTADSLALVHVEFTSQLHAKTFIGHGGITLTSRA